MPETVSWIELLWSVVAVAGLVFVSFRLARVWGDRQFNRRTGRNGTRAVIAGGNVRRAAEKLVKLAVCLIVGVAAMTQPQPTDTHVPTLAGWVVGLGLVWIEVTIAGGAYLDWRDDRRIDALERRTLRKYTGETV